MTSKIPGCLPPEHFPTESPISPPRAHHPRPPPSSINAILPLDPLQPLLPLRQILRTLRHLLRLVVEHDQVAVHEIEAVQLVAGLFGVGHLVVDHECGALGVGGVALADLAHRNEFTEEREEGGRVEVVGQVFDEEDPGR
jgi:hypothetical protein